MNTRVSIPFTADEPWTTVKLEDGTTVRVRIVVKDVSRLVDEFDSAGNPMYYLESQQVFFVNSPEELKRKNAPVAGSNLVN
jgi:hypothetical protein